VGLGVLPPNERAPIGIFDVSPDLRWVAVKLEGGSVHWTELLDATSGRVAGEHYGSSRAFSPDSKRIVVTGESDDSEDAIFWDLDTGKQLQSWRGVFIGNFVYNPDGRSIATGGKAVTIRDAETGKEVRRLPSKYKDPACGAGSGPKRFVADCSIPLAFSPDGHWLAVTTYRDWRNIDLWEATTGQQGRTLRRPEEAEGIIDVEHVYFTPDSQFLVATNGRDVTLWDTATGRELRKWQAKGAKRVAFSPDGHWMAVIVGDPWSKIGKDLTVWRRAD
jgi:WD40 repeat protein